MLYSIIVFFILASIAWMYVEAHRRDTQECPHCKGAGRTKTDRAKEKNGPKPNHV